MKIYNFRKRVFNHFKYYMPDEAARNYDQFDACRDIAQTQAEITGRIMYDEGFKAGIREVVESCLQAITDEPEFPSEMPDELWNKLNGNRENTTLAMRNSVRLTKEGITKRLQAFLKEKGIDSELD